MLIELTRFAASFTLEGIDIAWVPFLALVLFGLIVILPLALFRRWYFYRRRLSKNIITAEYEPPLGFKPAEIGYLFDGKVRDHEIGATIIHLVQSGHLHVKKVNGKKRIFAGPRIGSDLKAYEQNIIEIAENTDGVSLNQVLHKFVHLKTANIEANPASMQFAFLNLVHADLQKRQYVKKISNMSFITGSLKITLLLQFLVFYVPLGMIWILGTLANGTVDFKVMVGFLTAALVLSGMFLLPFFITGMILFYVRGRITGREWIITPKLERLWPQIIGYRQYVRMVENERLEFNSKDLAQISKNDTLPYAVALGFVRNWRDILS